jgi:hypothetical protein
MGFKLIPLKIGSTTTIMISIINQRLSRACIVHLVIKRTKCSYVKTMSYGIPINIKNTKFVKDLSMINSRWLPPQVIALTQVHMGKIEKYVLL